MRLEYDKATNTVFLYLKERIGPGEIKQGKLVDVDLPNSAVIASLDETGRVVRVEFMGADVVFSGSMLAAINDAGTPDVANEEDS